VTMQGRNGFRLVLVAEDQSAVAGGVPAVVHQLAQQANRARIPTDLVVARGQAEACSDGVRIHRVTPYGVGKRWGWNPTLHAKFRALAAHNTPAVFHLHGVWGAPQLLAARAAFQLRTPFVLSAHGMLDPWLWNRQGWRTMIKKRIYWRLFAHRAFRRASTIHAITPLEHDYLRGLFPYARIEIIPNAVDISPDLDVRRADLDRQILFLGRIEPKKGLHLLVQAFAQAHIGSDWHLDIVGPVWSDQYLRELRMMVEKAGVAPRVRFHTPVFGAAKDECLRKAWVVVLPSYSEAIGLVNLEAAAHWTPSITTHKTGLQDWESGGGLLTHPDVDDLRKSLESACSWSLEERRERGVASRRLVEHRYSWNTVFPMWLDLYKRLGAGLAMQ
jgi:glycosyltransferase involved in cell wall biosynthesis